MSKRVGGRKMITKYMKSVYGLEFDDEERAKANMIHFHENLRSRVNELSEHIIKQDSDLLERTPWYIRFYDWITLR